MQLYHMAWRFSQQALKTEVSEHCHVFPQQVFVPVRERREDKLLSRNQDIGNSKEKTTPDAFQSLKLIELIFGQVESDQPKALTQFITITAFSILLCLGMGRSNVRCPMGLPLEPAPGHSCVQLPSNGVCHPIGL
eukprot:2837716-Amphidinium_carterae.2